MTKRPSSTLLMLAAVILALGVWAYMRWGGDPTAPGRQLSTRAERGGQAGRVEVPVVDLRLERLTAERGELDEPQRNPFRFRQPPPPPPRVDTRGEPRPEVLAPPPPPPGPPAAPLIPLKFFGLAETGGTRVAWFADARGNVMHAKEGDIIEGRYRVLRIGPDSAELAHLDGRGRQTIRLSGQ